jgi:uncharacterized membrane protein
MGLFSDNKKKAVLKEKRKTGVTVNTISKTLRIPKELFAEIEDESVKRFESNKQGGSPSPNNSETIIHLIKKGLLAEKNK